jgi:hypothetical protein
VGTSGNKVVSHQCFPRNIDDGCVGEPAWTNLPVSFHTPALQDCEFGAIHEDFLFATLEHVSHFLGIRLQITTWMPFIVMEFLGAGVCESEVYVYILQEIESIYLESGYKGLNNAANQ